MHTCRPPFTLLTTVSRRQRVFGRRRDPDRCPSTGKGHYSVLQSTPFRHSAATPLHQPCKSIEGTLSSRDVASSTFDARGLLTANRRSWESHADWRHISRLAAFA